MAEYSVELRTLIENGKNIFPFDYPFYDEKERPNFERKFIRHFYFREIGSETVDRFILNLEDKMLTVFPYYNELFKTAQVEYSILDNYDITERTTTKRENKGQSSGESYAVGKTLDEQSSEVSEHRSSEKTDTGNTTSENTRNATNNGTATQTVDGTKTKTTNETENVEQNDLKKFLDTPQGMVDLKDSKYITTLNDDTSSRDTEKESTETATDEQTTTGTNSTTENVTDNGSVSQTANGSETEDGTTTSTMSGEQRTTNDSAVRSRSEGEFSETIEHTRKGNIGVDTDADMIQKHIKLQQILKKIELMFFDECEDLFMLVW